MAYIDCPTGAGSSPRPAVCVRVVAQAECVRVRQVRRQQIAQPVYAVARHLLLITMAVHAVDRDDAVCVTCQG